MPILLRRNREIGADWSYIREGMLPVGSIVAVTRVERFYRQIPTVYFKAVSKGIPSVVDRANLNCFDYIPKNSPEYKEIMSHAKT